MTADPAMDILRFLEGKGHGTYGRTLNTVLSNEMRKGSKHIRAALVPGASPPDHSDRVDYGSVEITVCGGEGERGRSAGARMAHAVYRDLALVCNGIPGYLNVAAAGPPQEYNIGTATVFAFRVDYSRYYGD